MQPREESDIVMQNARKIYNEEKNPKKALGKFPDSKEGYLLEYFYSVQLG
jgi:hypothetical protein